jgi:hypothetical protein
MLLKNDFEEGLRATLIQDDHRTRKFDSRSHRPRFDCCAPAPHRRFFNGIDPFRTSVRAGANLDSERFRSGPKSESNGHGISRDV